MTTTMSVFDDMRSYHVWKDKRDILVFRALDAGVPVERIAIEMGISKSVVIRLRKGYNSDNT